MVNNQLETIWTEELALDAVDENEDFFDIGGHSLIMARIQARIQKQLGVSVAMDALMRASTLKNIDELVQVNAAA